MDTNHNVNVTYQQKASLSTNKAFQVAIGTITLLVLLKMFFGGMFSGAWYSFRGIEPDESGFSSMALVSLIIDTLALVGLGSIVVYKFLWSFIVGVYEYWSLAVARGKAMAEGNQQAAAIGVAAAMSSVANDVAQSVSSSIKPKRTVDERLAILNSNDKEFKKLIDDHESRVVAIEIAVGLREAPSPPPPTVEEQLATLQAKLAEIEEAKTTKSRSAK